MQATPSNDWNGIYLGRRKGKDLIDAGKVDHGFDKASASEACGRICDEVRCEGCHFIWKAHSDWPWLGAHPADDPRKETDRGRQFQKRDGVRVSELCGWPLEEGCLTHWWAVLIRPMGPRGGVVTQRSAKPCTPVQ